MTETTGQPRPIYITPTIKGKTCPTCGQYIKLYPRLIHYTMARCLILLAKFQNGKDVFIHLPSETTKRGINYSNTSFALARYWGLIVQQENDNKTKRCSGMWKITKKGLDFIDDKIRLPKYIYLYNNELYNYTDLKNRTVNIKEALKNKFDYSELMNMR